MKLAGVLWAALVFSAAGIVANTAQAAERAVSQGIAGEDKEYEALIAKEAAAQAEVESWRKENRAAVAKGAGVAPAELEQRITERLNGIEQAYRDYLGRHPNEARARLAYGCFLNDRQDEAGAQAQWERVLALDPANADAYNNLAGRYCESGPIKKAFEFFSRSIELKPTEAAYYHNFADALYVLRSHAMTNYGLNEQQVFSKALLLYSNAARLDPHNSMFAWDFAQTYYALKPLPYQDALRAWTNALASADKEADREAIYLHLARVKMLAGWLNEARAQLNGVTNQDAAGPKAALLRAMEERQSPGSAGKENQGAKSR
ncbi:MAG TPA: hypothetical protein VG167_14360 [Verrucomicrobiae bacterium]|nr:hypothetical protein [Verrucomicrobiae bacterium]